MAEFLPAFDRMISNEGGYKLTNVKDDRGSVTYAGIARNRNGRWAGWSFIDRGEIPPTQMVRDFYMANFWDAVKGDYILHQSVAESLFDFAVNAGAKTAIKLAQIVGGVASDGDIGPKTLEALNAMDEGSFRIAYALAKIARYHAIVSKDRSQGKFLLGWVGRAIRGIC